MIQIVLVQDAWISIVDTEKPVFNNRKEAHTIFKFHSVM